MAARRKIDPAAGWAALDQWRWQDQVDAATLALAVRFSLEELAARAPGNSVEVRVPPYGATQIIAGVRHRRGTPPAVVQVAPHEWLALASGELTWSDAVVSGQVSASGERADLEPWLPLIPPLETRRVPGSG